MRKGFLSLALGITRARIVTRSGSSLVLGGEIEEDIDEDGSGGRGLSTFVGFISVEGSLDASSNKVVIGSSSFSGFFDLSKENSFSLIPGAFPFHFSVSSFFLVGRRRCTAFTNASAVASLPRYARPQRCSLSRIY